MKRLLLLLLLVPGLASAQTTYYVDCNADGDAGAGTSTASNVAWKTIAKVNAESFIAGDSILFNKGCTWREQLTMPSAGNGSNRLTWGAYGTGADPEFNGSEVVTSWSSAGYDISTPAAFVTSMGGDSVVLGLYDARYGITDSGGYVDSWDDARGSSGYGPQLAQASTKRPAWDNTNKLLTFDGTNDQLTAAAFADFDMTTSKTLAIITSGTPANYRGIMSLSLGNHYVQIGTRGSGNYFSECYAGSGNNPLLDSGVATSSTRRLMYVQNPPGGTTSMTVADSSATTGSAPASYASESPILDIASYFEGTSDRWAAVVVRAAVVIEGTLSATQIALLKAWAYNQHAAVMVSTAAVTDPSDTWTATTSAETNLVFKDDVRATKGSGALALTEGEWFASGTTLYFNQAAGNPDTEGNVMEAAVRDYGVYFNGSAYSTLQDITATKAKVAGIKIGASDNVISGVTVERVLASYNYCMGIESKASTALAQITTIQDSEMVGNGLQGVISGSCAAPAGLEVSGSDNTYGTLVEGNSIHGNAWAAELDQSTYNITFQNNHLYDNTVLGLNIDNSDNNQVLYNLITNNGTTTWGLRIWSETSGTVTGNQIYNNVIYGHGTGIVVEDEQTDLEIKNNLIVENTGGSSTEEISMESGHTYSGLDVDFNIYYRSSGTTYFDWGGTNYNWADWKTNSSQDANSPDPADPLFTDAGSDDFTISSSSPAFDAGTDVSLTLDYLGVSVPQGAAPDIGAYEVVVVSSSGGRSYSLGTPGQSGIVYIP